MPRAHTKVYRTVLACACRKGDGRVVRLGGQTPMHLSAGTARSSIHAPPSEIEPAGLFQDPAPAGYLVGNDDRRIHGATVVNTIGTVPNPAHRPHRSAGPAGPRAGGARYDDPRHAGRLGPGGLRHCAQCPRGWGSLPADRPIRRLTGPSSGGHHGPALHPVRGCGSGGNGSRNPTSGVSGRRPTRRPPSGRPSGLAGPCGTAYTP